MAQEANYLVKIAVASMDGGWMDGGRLVSLILGVQHTLDTSCR